MILACPSCDARFSLPDEALLPDGRTVRCSSCAHQWFAQSEAENAAEDADPEHEIEQVFAESETDDGDATEISEAVEPSAETLVAARRIARSDQRQSGAWMGWTALASMIAVILASSVLLADTISEIWPPAKRLYAMVNLPLAGPAAGLDIQNIKAHFEDGADGPLLVIEGDIVNMSGAVKSVPMVRVSLNDESRNELTQWVFAATDFNLIPSEIVAFRTSHQAPPEATIFGALGFSSDPPPAEEPADMPDEAE